MRQKILFIRVPFLVLLLLALVGGSIVGQPAAGIAAENSGSGVQVFNTAPSVSIKSPKAIGAYQLYSDRIAIPREDVVKEFLRDTGAVPLNAAETEMKTAVDGYYKDFFNKFNPWISPEVRERALDREAQLSSSTRANALQAVSAMVLALAVDFGGTDTYDIYTPESGYSIRQTITTSGPLKGQIPAPGSRDNNTVWYAPAQTADAGFYEKLIFGYEGVGRIRMDLTDPRDGQPGINLSGYTVQDYYDHVAGAGNVIINGSVEGWVTVEHSEGYYGADVNGATHYGGAIVNNKYVPVAQLVIDAIDKFNQLNPDYYNDTSAGAFWKKYDANHDGIVDSFWIIHAGMGQESGGGAEGDLAIWSHSSDLRNYSSWPSGYKVYEGDDSTTEDDIYIGPYTMQPENADLGVFCEEFGHNFFGLPDLYTNDYDNSIGFWSIMSGGAWGGYLGGSVPVGMPLWFREIAQCDGIGFLNWQEPMATLDYQDAAVVNVGQLEKPPTNTYKGVRINLPDIVEPYDNKAGDGKCAFTLNGRDMVDLTLDREIAVGNDAVSLSMDSYWDIEEGWDYGYVMIKDSDTWSILDEVYGSFTTSNPNGNNLGYGLTGFGQDKLSFDLSPYQGKTVTLRLLYKTDAAVTGEGWYVDNIKLDDTLIDDFETIDSSSIDGWTNSEPGWVAAPYEKAYANYYLVEWRAPTKYDNSVKTAYLTSYSDDDEWQVERVPYNIPGALVYYRNSKYGATYSLTGDNKYYDSPSIGPKYQLLAVDMNYDPLRLDNSGVSLGCRTSSYDAALTLQPSQPITINKAYGVAGGPWTLPEQKAVTEFDDFYGCYAGVYVKNGYAYYKNRAGSVVIPAGDIYSTRITHEDGTPAPEYYGYTLSGLPLGTGNPGDDGVAYGVKIGLIAKSDNNDTATLCVNGNKLSFADNKRDNLELSVNTDDNNFKLILPDKEFPYRKAGDMRVINLDSRTAKFNNRTKTWSLNTTSLKLNPLLAAQVANYRFDEKPSQLVFLSYKDTDFTLDALAIGGKADFCYATVRDLKNRKTYILQDKFGVEK